MPLCDTGSFSAGKWKVLHTHSQLYGSQIDNHAGKHMYIYVRKLTWSNPRSLEKKKHHKTPKIQKPP